MRFQAMTIADILEKCKESTVKAGGLLFQYCPEFDPERPYLVTIPRKGRAHLSAGEIARGFDALELIPCEIMR